jgi:hypothetical protein
MERIAFKVAEPIVQIITYKKSHFAEANFSKLEIQ